MVSPLTIPLASVVNVLPCVEFDEPPVKVVYPAIGPVKVAEAVTKTIVILEGNVSEAVSVVRVELRAAFCGKAAILAEFIGGKGAVTLIVVSRVV